MYIKQKIMDTSFLNSSNLKKVVCLLFFLPQVMAFLCCDFCLATSSSDKIKTAVNSAVGNILPDGSVWQVNMPSFVKLINYTNIQELEVSFASDFSANSDNNNFIANVWAETETGAKLFAIPVEIISVNKNSQQWHLTQK